MNAAVRGKRRDKFTQRKLNDQMGLLILIGEIAGASGFESYTSELFCEWSLMAGTDLNIPDGCPVSLSLALSLTHIPI